MLAEERLSRIMKLLSQQRTATVQELCEALDASESTIRRDLNELDRMGKVNKVHGGATLPDSQFLADEPTMATKETLAVVQKKCIAKAAAALITAEDFVFLDAGSTTLALARELNGPALDARYVTNGVAHARLLAQKGCKVFLVGGLLRPETEAIIGAAALHSLQQYNFTKAFLGANGVALDAGFTTPDPEEAAVKAAVVRRAREAWFLVDDSKFACIYPAVIAELFHNKFGNFVKSSLFVPVIASAILVGTLWFTLLSPRGVVNSIIHAFGLPSVNWLGGKLTSMLSVCIVSVWKNVGYFLVIYFAGIMDIPRSLYEAAEVDGANAFQRFFKITLPGLSSVTFLVVTLGTIWSFQVFDLVYTMTGGGPGTSTVTLVLTTYNAAFKEYNMGYASAVAMLMFVFVLAVSGLQKLLLKGGED